MTIDFANNNLNGKSKWRAAEFRDYDTSRTRVCVTVGMMTTGYDCEDLLNVALARPIFSPTDFIQIKGRGTRLFTFKHGDGTDQRLAAKDGFALFDFFANCEYFENDFNYDQKLTLPRGPSDEDGGDEGGTGGGGRVESFTNTSADPMATVVREEVGLTGMKIDREMYRERFERQTLDAVAADTALKEAIETENWPAIEDNIRRLLFEKPDEFWNLPKLQNLFKTDRLPTLREILARVLGFATGISTRNQLANEEFERFLATQEINPTHLREMRTVFTAFLLDPDSRAMLMEGRFAELRARDASLYGSLSQLSTHERDTLLSYLQSQVSLKQFDLAV